jgi:hypothetical protein
LIRNGSVILNVAAWGPTYSFRGVSVVEDLLLLLLRSSDFLVAYSPIANVRADSSSFATASFEHDSV